MRVSILSASPRVLALVAVNAVIAACLLTSAWRGTQTAALLATAPRSMPLPEVDLTRPPVTTRLATLEDRTLLYASRHVYVAPPPDLAPPRPAYRLVGTFIIPSRPAVALLTSPQDASRKVKPGDMLDGWLVEAVERHRVTLRHESETFDLADAVPEGVGLTVQRAPLASTAPPSPGAGVRLLGQPAASQATAGSPASPAPSTPRLYQPPPK
jgi:hypothetical protein